MAAVACLPVRETLRLPDLHDKASARWADVVDIVTTPSPWADNDRPDFYLPPVSSSLDEPDTRTDSAYPLSLEATLAHPVDTGVQFAPVQYVYLDPQCLPLQDGLAQMYLATKKPDYQQPFWCLQDVGHVPNDQNWACGYALHLDGIENIISGNNCNFGSTPLRGDCISQVDAQAKWSCESMSDSESTTTSSVDQAQHSVGQCKPCAWFWKKQGCRNGEACNYCHLCPQGELKSRKKARVIELRAATKPQR
jgi:hypothetical protein